MNLLFGFSGRIGRAQWWLGQLAIFAVCIACAGALAAIVGLRNLSAAAKSDFTNVDASVVAMLFAATMLTVWISFALSIKRFHDRGKSGFWCLIVLVPYIGALWQFVECGFLSGSDGTNRFGGTDGLAGNPANRLDFDRPTATPLRAAAMPAAAAVRPQNNRFGRPQGFGRRGA